MKNREYDHLFKLVIIGNTSVGKSSLLLRFSDDQFNENYLTTIGVDFRFKTLDLEKKRVKLQIWDTAGQERFRTITNAYYKGADAIVMVYDTTNQQTFDDIEQFWIKEVQNYAEKDTQLVLLGNKCDVTDEKSVDTELVQRYADSKNIMFFETSAKTCDLVSESFNRCAQKLVEKKEASIAERKKQRRESRKKTLDKTGLSDIETEGKEGHSLTKDNLSQKEEQKVKKYQKLTQCCN